MASVRGETGGNWAQWRGAPLDKEENPVAILTSPLDHGYITRYLVSETRGEAIKAKPVTIEGEQNVWIGSTAAASHENPIRKAFLEEVREKGIPMPVLDDVQPGGKVRLLSSPLALSYSAPFGNPVVGQSHFYSTPLWISLAAITGLVSPDEREIEVLCSLKGGMTLHLNGEKAIDFRPYRRNEQIDETFTLKLKEGLNEIVLTLDEFAERDTECTVSIRVTKGSEGLAQQIPMGERDTAKIAAVEAAMASLAFKRNNFLDGDVVMTCDTEELGEGISFHLKGATEENTFLGIYDIRDAVFAPGTRETSLGPVESFPVGFLRYNVSTTVENLEIRTIRTAEVFPRSFMDEPAKTVQERKRQAWSYLAKWGEQNANRAMALLYTNGDKEEIETILRRQLDFINRRSDCSDFYLSYFPWMINHFSDSGLIRKETLEDMKSCLLNFRYWHDEPGDDAMWFYSENHALMFHVCQLIAGEMYPDEIFTNSGMTGTEMQEKAKGMLRPWFETFFKTGFTEWNSPPYLPIDALGFASLYAQTSDAEMKENAEKALDYIFRLLAVTSYEGVFSTTSGRTYLKEIFGNHANCPSFINWIGYGIGNESHAGKGVVPFCFSSYEPPEAYRAFHRVPDGKALSWKSTHGYDGYADVTVYKTANYLLSAANDFEPGRRGFQEDVVHAVFGADEHVFVNHPGEFALFGHARPSYWAGSGTLPRVNQYKNFASVNYRINPGHPVDFTHAYWPTMEFRRTLMKGGWAFAETHSGAWCAIWAANGLELVEKGPNAGRELTSPGHDNLWLIRLSSASEDGSFESFVDKVLSAEVSLSCDTMDWEFRDWRHGELKGGFTQSLEVNGVAEVYKGFTPVGETVWEDL